MLTRSGCLGWTLIGCACLVGGIALLQPDILLRVLPIERIKVFHPLEGLWLHVILIVTEACISVFMFLLGSAILRAGTRQEEPEGDSHQNQAK